MAHRGGALHPEIPGTENTLHAFRHAVALGYRYLETDVHATSDGVLLAFHDAVLDRVTDLQGRLSELTADQVVGGPHPRRAPGARRWPSCSRSSPSAASTSTSSRRPPSQPLADLLDRTGSHDRVCVGSFSQRRLDRVPRGHRRPGRHVGVAAGGRALPALPSGRAARLLTRGRVAALQVPHRRGPVPVVTRELVRRAHAAGAHVHVWTVDEPAEMDELLDLGVDGLITDRTDVLKDVLGPARTVEGPRMSAHAPLGIADLSPSTGSGSRRPGTGTTGPTRPTTRPCSACCSVPT